MPTHQWTGNLVSFSGPGGNEATSATTQSRSYAIAPIASIGSKGNNLMWSQGAFGVSVIQHVGGAGAAANWTVTIWGRLSGTSIKVAEIAGISGLSNMILPIVNEWTHGILGSTQSSAIGIPTPRGISIIASSAGIGVSFGAVIYGVLRGA